MQLTAQRRYIPRPAPSGRYIQGNNLQGLAFMSKLVSLGSKLKPALEFGANIYQTEKQASALEEQTKQQALALKEAQALAEAQRQAKEAEGYRLEAAKMTLDENKFKIAGALALAGAGLWYLSRNRKKRRR